MLNVMFFVTDKCIKSCEMKKDGNYASCSGCEVYATCTASVLQDDIPCGMDKGKQLYWDAKKKACTKKKPKHCDDDHDDDDGKFLFPYTCFYMWIFSLV